MTDDHARCGYAHIRGNPYPAPTLKIRPKPAPMMQVQPAPMMQVQPAPMMQVQPAPVSGWEGAAVGDAVVWVPTARLAAKGVAPVEGTLRALGRGSTTRFAKVDTGARVATVWENQGELRVIGASAARSASTTDLTPRETITPAASSRKKGSKSGTVLPTDVVPSVFAGHAPRKVELPEGASAKAKDFASALHAVEQLLPVLSAQKYAPVRDALARARRALEKSGEVTRDYRLTELLSPLRDSGTPAQWATVGIVMALLTGREPVDVRRDARDVRATVEYDESGGDWSKLMVEASGDPIYGTWYRDEPTLVGASPSGSEAVEKVVTIAEEDEWGWAMVDPATVTHNSGHRNASSSDVQEWLNMSDDATCRRQEVDFFNAKTSLMGDVLTLRRTGKMPPDPFGRFSWLRERIHNLRRCRLYAAAWRHGLRSPAQKASPRLEAKLATRIAEARAKIGPLTPPVEAALQRGAAVVRQVADKVRADYDRARSTDRSLRVPQAAHVGELAEKKLLEAASSLADRSLGYDSRMGTLTWLARGGWTSYEIGPDYRNDSAYARSVRKFLREAEWDVESVVVPVIQSIDGEAARTLASLERQLEVLTERGRWSPWDNLYRKPHSPVTDSQFEAWTKGERRLTHRPRSQA